MISTGNAAEEAPKSSVAQAVRVNRPGGRLLQTMLKSFVAMTGAAFVITPSRVFAR
jgi:hypothetical protein